MYNFKLFNLDVDYVFVFFTFINGTLTFSKSSSRPTTNVSNTTLYLIAASTRIFSLLISVSRAFSITSSVVMPLNSSLSESFSSEISGNGLNKMSFALAREDLAPKILDVSYALV